MVTIGTKKVSVEVTKYWTAENPGPFGAVGCSTWTETRTVSNTFPIQVTKQRDVYKTVPVYHLRSRPKYKTVTVTVHEPHTCPPGQTLVGHDSCVDVVEPPRDTPTPTPSCYRYVAGVCFNIGPDGRMIRG